ncbi:MAG: hypothetical protein GY952_20755 [Rhodobacteraceae bacterium]|nr:hypothetical protein [Paracoccaceae bacterium]
MNAVSLRTAPPRSSASKPVKIEKTTEAEVSEAPDNRSALQRLVDKFR